MNKPKCKTVYYEMAELFHDLRQEAKETNKLVESWFDQSRVHALVRFYFRLMDPEHQNQSYQTDLYLECIAKTDSGPFTLTLEFNTQEKTCDLGRLKWSNFYKYVIPAENMEQLKQKAWNAFGAIGIDK